MEKLVLRVANIRCLDCRHQDIDKVEAVVRSMQLHIETTAGIDHRLPQGVGLLVSTLAMQEMGEPG